MDPELSIQYYQLYKGGRCTWNAGKAEGDAQGSAEVLNELLGAVHHTHLLHTWSESKLYRHNRR